MLLGNKKEFELPYGDPFLIYETFVAFAKNRSSNPTKE